MPLVSQAQMRWMFSEHPDMAREWAEETPNIASLPERLHPKKGGHKKYIHGKPPIPEVPKRGA